MMSEDSKVFVCVLDDGETFTLLDGCFVAIVEQSNIDLISNGEIGFDSSSVLYRFELGRSDDLNRLAFALEAGQSKRDLAKAEAKKIILDQLLLACDRWAAPTGDTRGRDSEHDRALRDVIWAARSAGVIS